MVHTACVVGIQKLVPIHMMPSNNPHDTACIIWIIVTDYPLKGNWLKLLQQQIKYTFYLCTSCDEV
jgi:hypothetical protein